MTDDDIINESRVIPLVSGSGEVVLGADGSIWAPLLPGGIPQLDKDLSPLVAAAVAHDWLFYHDYVEGQFGGWLVKDETHIWIAFDLVQFPNSPVEWFKALRWIVDDEVVEDLHSGDELTTALLLELLGSWLGQTVVDEADGLREQLGWAPEPEDPDEEEPEGPEDPDEEEPEPEDPDEPPVDEEPEEPGDEDPEPEPEPEEPVEDPEDPEVGEQ
ncbi:hypothetical protein SEA_PHRAPPUCCINO_150 [Mycobacterium phage Phrappuccino]|uniref:Uncharacterized protein n=1 Tax=Mycobacterium phage Phrappuccino TaxID=2591223 RepID=A0A514DDY6_9CAUD|nr:hypothetical protein KHQ87_gp150 [Mycobacterium phage Phrappuccino]QDH91825.1 hypothetical protein SEA_PHRAPPUCCINO_150 [Mycobacterium phage Phrappuccino]QIQ63267.1 hypothetical protein SEA_SETTECANDELA_150 [Mycobacterium phage Settecandela]